MGKLKMRGLGFGTQPRLPSLFRERQVGPLSEALAQLFQYLCFEPPSNPFEHSINAMPPHLIDRAGTDGLSISVHFFCLEELTKSGGTLGSYAYQPGCSETEADRHHVRVLLAHAAGLSCLDL